MFELKMPTLIKLTQIVNPDLAEGKSLPAYVNPLHITMIVPSRDAFIKEGGSPNETHPRVDCTLVCLVSGQQVMVIEPAETVASLHEKSLREIVEH